LNIIGHGASTTKQRLEKWAILGRGEAKSMQETKKIGSICEKTCFCRPATLGAELDGKTQATSS